MATTEELIYQVKVNTGEALSEIERIKNGFQSAKTTMNDLGNSHLKMEFDRDSEKKLQTIGSQLREIKNALELLEAKRVKIVDINGIQQTKESLRSLERELTAIQEKVKNESWAVSTKKAIKEEQQHNAELQKIKASYDDIRKSQQKIVDGSKTINPDDFNNSQKALKTLEKSFVAAGGHVEDLKQGLFSFYGSVERVNDRITKNAIERQFEAPFKSVNAELRTLKTQYEQTLDLVNRHPGSKKNQETLATAEKNLREGLSRAAKIQQEYYSKISKFDVDAAHRAALEENKAINDRINSLKKLSDARRDYDAIEKEIPTLTYRKNRRQEQGDLDFLSKYDMAHRFKPSYSETPEDYANAFKRKRLLQENTAAIEAQNKQIEEGVEAKRHDYDATVKQMKANRAAYVAAGGKAQNMPLTPFEKTDFESLNDAIRRQKALMSDSEPKAYAQAIGELTRQQQKLFQQYEKDPTRENALAYQAVTKNLNEAKASRERYLKSLPREQSEIDSLIKQYNTLAGGIEKSLRSGTPMLETQYANNIKSEAKVLKELSEAGIDLPSFYRRTYSGYKQAIELVKKQRDTEAALEKARSENADRANREYFKRRENESKAFSEALKRDIEARVKAENDAEKLIRRHERLALAKDVSERSIGGKNRELSPYSWEKYAYEEREILDKLSGMGIARDKIYQGSYDSYVKPFEQAREQKKALEAAERAITAEYKKQSEWLEKGERFDRGKWENAKASVETLENLLGKYKELGGDISKFGEIPLKALTSFKSMQEANAEISKNAVKNFDPTIVSSYSAKIREAQRLTEQLHASAKENPQDAELANLYKVAKKNLADLRAQQREYMRGGNRWTEAEIKEIQTLERELNKLTSTYDTLFKVRKEIPITTYGNNYEKETEKRARLEELGVRVADAPRYQSDYEAYAKPLRLLQQMETAHQKINKMTADEGVMLASGNKLHEDSVRTLRAKAEAQRTIFRAAKEEYNLLMSGGGGGGRPPVPPGVNPPDEPPLTPFERNFDVTAYNRERGPLNARAWSNEITGYSAALSNLRSEQERLYSTYMKDPSKQNLANFMAVQKQIQSVREEYGQYQRVIDNTESAFSRFKRRAISHLEWITSGTIISAMGASYYQLIDTIKQIDTAMAGIKQVMPAIEGIENSNVFGSIADQQHRANEEARALIGIASKYGESIGKVMDAARSIGRMYGQGANGQANTNLMVQQAAKMATADAFDMIDATRGLESAMSQWNLQTEDTQQLLVNTNRILDVWTKTAHRGAASAQDIGQAIEIAGTAAAQAGVSFEFFNSLVATGVRATARSGNEIGNAIKSMMVSMQSAKSIKALEDFGIQIYKIGEDGTKTMRSMQDIILDVSLALQTTDKDTSKLLMTLSGGKFQYSKVSAMLKNYDELLHMISETSTAQGFTDEQVTVQLETLSRKMQTIKDDISALAVSIGENGLLSGMISIAEHIDNIIVGLRKLPPELKYVLAGFVAFKVAASGIDVVSRRWNIFTAALSLTRGELKSTTDAATAMAAANRLANAGFISQEEAAAIAAGKRTLAINEETVAEERSVAATNSSAAATSNSSNVTIKNTGDIARNTQAINANIAALGRQTAAQSGVRNISVSGGAVTGVGLNASVGAQAKQAAQESAKANRNLIVSMNGIAPASQKGIKGIRGISTALSAVTGVAATASAAFKGLIAAFGGPWGFALTALQVALPFMLQWSEATGEAENATRKLAESTDEAIAKAQQEGQEAERRKETARTLAKQYNDLAAAVEREGITEEEKTKKTALMGEISQRVAKILKSNTDEFVSNGRISMDSINKLSAVQKQAALDELAQQEKKLEADYETTRQMIIDAESRVNSLIEEGKAVGLLGRIYNAFYGIVAGGLKVLGRDMAKVAKNAKENSMLKDLPFMRSAFEGMESFGNLMFEKGSNMMEINSRVGGAAYQGEITEAQVALGKLREKIENVTGSLEKIRESRDAINTPPEPYNPGITEDKDDKKDDNKSSSSGDKLKSAENARERLANKMDSLKFKARQEKYNADDKKLTDEIDRIKHYQDTYGATGDSTSALRALRDARMKLGQEYARDLKAMQSDLATKYNSLYDTQIFEATAEDANEKLEAGINNWLGHKMDLAGVGCVEAVEKIGGNIGDKTGKYFSEFLKREFEKGVRNVDQLVNDAGRGNVIPFSEEMAEPGDIVVYDKEFSYHDPFDYSDTHNNHVLMVVGRDEDGNLLVVGNSSSANKVLKQNLYQGQHPGNLIKTGWIDGTSTGGKINFPNNLADFIAPDDWAELDPEGKIEFLESIKDELAAAPHIIAAIKNIMAQGKAINEQQHKLNQQMIENDKEQVEDIKKRYETAARDADYKATEELTKLGANATDIDRQRIELDQLKAKYEESLKLMKEFTPGTVDYSNWRMQTLNQGIEVSQRTREYKMNRMDKLYDARLQANEDEYQKRTASVWADEYAAKQDYLKNKVAILNEKLREQEEELAKAKEEGDKAREAQEKLVESIEKHIDALQRDKEAGQDVDDELAKLTEELKKQLEILENLKTVGTKAEQEITESIRKTKGVLAEATKEEEEIIQDLKEIITDGMSSMFEGVLLEGKKFSDGFKALWKDLARYAIRQMTARGMAALFEAIAPAAGAAEGGLIDSKPLNRKVSLFAKGGKIPGFAEGHSLKDRVARSQQYIRGAGTGKSDSILAYLANKDKFVYLSNGEYVMTAEATKRIGVRNLDAMNSGHFAEGGALNPIPYVPQISPRVAEKAEKLGMGRSMTDRLLAEQNRQMNEQNALLKRMGEGGEGSGGVVVLNTHASSDDVMRALQENPRMVQAILGRQERMGFR